MPPPLRRALISVYDKTGLVAFARRLVAMGWEVVASGGTARALTDAAIPHTTVESITRHAEAFDGRMKTISFEIESAILFDRRNPRHLAQAEALDITPIDMVVCNFYPFASVLARSDARLDDAVEQIDVGGPTMVRAAAKNFASVAVVLDPAQYEALADEMANHGGLLTLPTRRALAARAFQELSAYDLEIGTALQERWPAAVATQPGAPSAEQPDRPDEAPPELRILRLKEAFPLRYGENPHQPGKYFHEVPPSRDPLALDQFAQIQGKQLSYNNLLDADAVLYALCLIGDASPAACIVKHTNPCGAAVGDTVHDAFLRAWEGDTTAAFGGIAAVNRPIDRPLADLILAEGRFFEVILAPAVEDEARERLAARKNLRILENAALAEPHLVAAWDYRSIRGGMLAQLGDRQPLDPATLKRVTEKPVPPDLVPDLRLAWQLCRASRSNAVTLVRNGQLVGNGVGQQDRVTSCRLAVEKAGERTVGAVAASDAFFPFPDGPEVLARAGIAAIVQPGGSVRDQETFELCDRHGVAMVTTGVRCFRH